LEPQRTVGTYPTEYAGARMVRLLPV